MSTISKSTSVNLGVKNEVSVNQKTVSTFWQDMEDARFAITPIILTIMACVGGFAAAVAIQESWIQLAFVAFPATFALATILGVMPMRTVVYSAAVAVLIDIIIFII